MPVVLAPFSHLSCRMGMALRRRSLGQPLHQFAAFSREPHQALQRLIRLARPHFEQGFGCKGVTDMTTVAQQGFIGNLP
jgi:hypothetical protein